MNGMTCEKGFTQTIFIKRVDGQLPKNSKHLFPFEMTYMGNDKMVFNFSEFKEEGYNEKKNMIKFVISKQRFFTIEFRFKYDFKTVVKFLEEKNHKAEVLSNKRALKEIGIPQRVITQDRVKITNDIINNYSAKNVQTVDEGAKKKKGIMISSSSASGSQREDDREYFLPMINTVPRRWRRNEMLMWFSQIPYHDIEKKKLTCVYEFLREKRLLEYIEDFFSRKEHRSFTFLEVMVHELVNEKEDQEIKKRDALYDIIKPHETLVKRLYKHFEYMKHLNYEYMPSFYIILKKQLIHSYSSSIVQENPEYFNLEGEEFVILYEKKYFWSVRALRRKISFNFLFGMSIGDYSYLLMREFKRFQERRTKKQKEQPSKSGNRYEEALEKFNEDNGIVLEDLSLPVFLQKRCLVAKSKWTELKLRKRQLQTDLEELTKKRGNNERFVKAEAKAKDPKKTEKQREVLQKQLQRVKERIFAAIDKKLRKLQGELEKVMLEEKQKMKEYLASNPAKIMRNPQRIKQERVDFVSRKEFHDAVKALIHGKLKLISQANQDIRLTSKLVLSRHQEKAIPFIKKFSMDVVKSILNPSFFKFGFIHGYVIVCNVGFHFFGSGIVYVEDIKNMSQMMEKYEDLACLDTHSQLITTYERFANFVTDISKFVVDWNSNYEYSFAGIRKFQTRYVRNCQEFALSLLRDCLRVPQPFYPRIEKYINDMTFLHNKKMLVQEEEDEGEDDEGGEEVKVYRYIRITEDLPEDIRVVLCKGKKKMYFRTHKELDLFVYDCLNVCNDLEVLFPGLYQLLKAFDRSFWIQKMYRIFPDETNEPGRLAGNIICHFFRGGDAV